MYDIGIQFVQIITIEDCLNLNIRSSNFGYLLYFRLIYG